MKDAVTEIILVFDDCYDATTDQLYFPVEKVGVVVRHAVSLRREINSLKERVKELERTVQS